MGKPAIKTILRKIEKIIPENDAFLSALRTKLVISIDGSFLGVQDVDYKIVQPVFRKKFVFAASLSILIILLIGVTTVYASQKSLPGQTLYPVKILSENARLYLAFSAQDQANVRIEYAQRRVEEINAILKDTSTEDKAIQDGGSLEDAITNFNYQTEKILEQSNKLRQHQETEKAEEVDDYLTATVTVYQKVLEKRGGVSSKAGDENFNVSTTSFPESGNATESTAESFQSAPNIINSAEAKIKAAEKKIKEAKNFIAESEKKNGLEGLSSAKQEIQSAEKKISEAKNYLAAGDYQKSFLSAKEASKSAIKAKVLADLLPRLDGDSFDASIMEEDKNQLPSQEITNEEKATDQSGGGGYLELMLEQRQKALDLKQELEQRDREIQNFIGE